MAGAVSVRVEHGDMRTVLGRMVAEGQRVQSIVTDPPYHLTSIVQRFGATDAAPAKVGKTGAYARASAGFMGKKWDGGDIAFRPGTWRLCWELLPPGGHLVAFGGTRTFHRLVCAIEEAGFEIRDTLSWNFGSGFPKSRNVAKAIDTEAGRPIEIVPAGKPVKRMIPGADQNKAGWEKTNGREYQPGEYVPSEEAAPWNGWGTALKPAMELICLARKPLKGTVAANVLRYGAGALNIDGCRVAGGESTERPNGPIGYHGGGSGGFGGSTLGRWPANVCHDGSDEVVRAFPQSTSTGGTKPIETGASIGTFEEKQHRPFFNHGDTGSAARLFYSAKADADDRLGSKHPTVKPVDLMRWLVRMITPPGGTCLDPFAGSGTTGMACMAEGFDCILIEREAEYVADIKRRLAHVKGEDTPLFAEALL